MHSKHAKALRRKQKLAQRAADGTKPAAAPENKPAVGPNLREDHSKSFKRKAARDSGPGMILPRRT